MKKFLLLTFAIFNHKAMGTESIGYYSEGSLLNAKSVVREGSPIHKLFIARNRLYTSDEMQDLLFSASEFLKENYDDSEPLQVGDLSNSKGGLANGHASHQNGLDGDIVYLRRNHKLTSPEALTWDEDFVGKSSPTSNFDAPRNMELFKHLVETTTVTRIFVDVSIKKYLCQSAFESGMNSDPLTKETLRRLRPENLHRTHFHVRISCPINDHKCTPQSAPPLEDGCDELSLMLDFEMSKESIQGC